MSLAYFTISSFSFERGGSRRSLHDSFISKQVSSLFVGTSVADAFRTQCRWCWLRSLIGPSTAASCQSDQILLTKYTQKCCLFIDCDSSYKIQVSNRRNTSFLVQKSCEFSEPKNSDLVSSLSNFLGDVRPWQLLTLFVILQEVIALIMVNSKSLHWSNCCWNNPQSFLSFDGCFKPPGLVVPFCSNV